MSQKFPRTADAMVVIAGDVWNDLVTEVERLGKISVGTGLELKDGPDGIGFGLRPGRQGLFPVSLTVTAGQTDATHGGSQTTAPTYTYTMKVLDGETELGTALSPRVGRRFGKFVAATDGEAYVKSDGTYGLWQAYESTFVSNCAS
jgi:hypothetical protein